MVKVTPKAIAIQANKELSLKQMVDIETKNREILTQYIATHMKKGTDYGPIHIAKKDKCPNPWNCTIEQNPYHYSKDCLFKPGSEKFTSLMKLTPKFKKDQETWEMAGSKPGLFTYVCELIDMKGKIVGEGRGAADLNEKNWSANNAIKIAQKRAQIDAVLRTGGLSDFFTQDLEDMFTVDAPKTQNAVLPPVKSHENTTPPPPPPQKRMISAEQQVKFRQLMIQKGKSMEDIEGVIASTPFGNGTVKTKLSELTEAEAKEFIIAMERKLPDVKEPEVNIDEVDEGIKANKPPVSMG